MDLANQQNTAVKSQDTLRELKAIREKLGKELEKETKEYEFRKGSRVDRYVDSNGPMFVLEVV